MTKTKRLMIYAALFASATGFASADQLTYQPTNPTFGGNALNGNFLLSTAQTQGAGVKSGQQQSPDLSGLNSALSNLGDVGTGTSGSAPIIVIGNGTIPTTP